MMNTKIRSGSFTDEEIVKFIFYTKKRWGVRLPKDLTLILDKDADGAVHITYDPPINRSVYRSTDYLVNNMEKLNTAKQSEQTEKQMHLVD